MPDLARYHRQIEAARNVGLRMTRAQIDAFLQILEGYAEDLAARIAAGTGRQGAARARALADEIIRSLVRDLALSTKHGVTLTASRAAQIYADALTSLLGEGGGGLGVAISRGIGIQAAQAVLSRPELSAAFKTIRAASVASVDQIITSALLRGTTSTQFAMELRLHMLGSEALPPELLLDRRRIGYAAIQALGYMPTRENLLFVRAHAGKIANAAQLIARTEPMNAEWEAHRQSAAESDVVAAIGWETSSRHAVPDQCDVLQDTDFYGLGAGIYPPEVLPRRPHPRCFIPGTRVSGLFARGFRAEYSGDVYEIETVGGKKLTVTPNHPVLTPSGWAAARDLHEGQELVCYRTDADSVGVVPAHHEGHAPALIEDVFVALREAGTVSTQQRSSEDLHGDARFGHGDIEIVGADWILEFGGQAPSPQSLGDPPLVLPDVQLPLVASLGGAFASFARVGAPPFRAMGGPGDPMAELRVLLQTDAHPGMLGFVEAPQSNTGLPEDARHGGTANPSIARQHVDRLSREVSRDEAPRVGEFDPLGFGDAAALDASVFQPAGHGPVGDAKLLADLSERSAAIVEIDRVKYVTRKRYSGHVYDLQSMHGYIVAGGLFTSNCICRHRDILRPVEEWGTPKPPTPELRVEPTDAATAAGLTPSQAASLESAVKPSAP